MQDGDSLAEKIKKTIPLDSQGDGVKEFEEKVPVYSS